MPVIEDWLNRPLDIVQGNFDSSKPDWSNKVTDYFTAKFSKEDTLSWIPSLNEVPLHQLKPNSLVRYRGMIQDMFDPEYYLGVYEVEDVTTGSKSYKTGKYRDIAECLPGHRVNMESSQNVTMDRHTYYCIPVPGESPWIKQAYSERSQKVCSPSCSYTTERNKRPLEQEGEETETHPAPSIPRGPDQSTIPDPNRQQLASRPTLGVPDLDLHYPLPGEKGPPCIVKVYEQTDALKLNNMVEVVGILAVDPVLTQFPEGHSNSGSSGDAMEGIEEESTSLPPSSLVPRLHAISIKTLQHINPLVDSNLYSSSQALHIPPTTIEQLQREAGKLRDQLRGLLQQLLLGDAFSADYLLLHLLANIYARRDVVALGKFSLNISGCPKMQAYTRFIYEVITQLVTKSHFLPLTLSNINSLCLTPKKDYSTNRLRTGLLQLPERTQIVMDETAMEPGQLDTNGVRNITTIGNVISWQKLDYDFNFHRTDFPTNLRFLTLSEGRSLITHDCQVPLTPRTQVNDVETFKASIQGIVTSDSFQLRDVRCYLTVLPLLEYHLSDDLQKVVEEDFVEARKNDPQSMTTEDFHNHLVLSRLMSLSLGQTQLKREVWERVKRMEAERKSRLRNQAPRS